MRLRPDSSRVGTVLALSGILLTPVASAGSTPEATHRAGRQSTGAGLAAVVRQELAPPWRARYDFDADSRSDLAVFHEASGLWFIRGSATGGSTGFGFGGPGYLPVVADYDGDLRAEVAMYHPPTGLWFFRNYLTGTVTSQGWGGSAYEAVPGDYDGDGKTDVAAFHTALGLWFIRQSSQGGALQTFDFGGGGGYTTVPRDYDGDGKTDLAVYHASSGLWFVRNSSTGSASSIGFGGPDYQPVPGDYDGDGKDDLAVYHTTLGLWFIKSSSTGVVTSMDFGGGPGYTPVPADFDSDHKLDLALYNESSGLWFWKLSSTGAVMSQGYGGPGYRPVGLNGLFVEGESSAGVVSLNGASPTAFNPTSLTLSFQLAGATFSAAPEDTQVVVNGATVDPQLVTVGTAVVSLPCNLIGGRNEVRLVSLDANGLAIASDFVLWAGNASVQATVWDPQTASAAPGVVVEATLGDDPAVRASLTSDANGKVTFSHLPYRSIHLTARDSGNRTAGLPVAVGIDLPPTLVLRQFDAPSPINNNDFSLGTLDGWNVGSAPATLVTHSEGPTAAPAQLALAGARTVRGRAELGRSRPEPGAAVTSPALAGDLDLQLATSGEGSQFVSRTFQSQAGTKNATVRYRFVTEEIPGGYFGSQYNDYYRVSVRSQVAGAEKVDANSMNALGLGAFDANGATGWRDVNLPVNPNGDTLQVDLTVANVADGLYDSYLVVDLVSQKQLGITALTLLDIDNGPLQFLSAAPHPYFSGKTRVNGTVTVTGDPADGLQSLTLEVTRGGQTIATGQLVPGAATALLKPFGPGGTVQVTSPQLLFEIDSSAFATPTADGTLTLRLQAISTFGQQAQFDFPRPVQVLGLYTPANRYGTRDEGRGGDGWVLPTLRDVVAAQSGLLLNDFSNMNAGSFDPDHKEHRAGTDVDGWFNGYNALDAQTAQTMLAYLRDPLLGPHIERVFVTFEPVPSDPFWTAIANEMVGAQPARTIIRKAKKHTTHFHWLMKP